MKKNFEKKNMYEKRNISLPVFPIIIIISVVFILVPKIYSLSSKEEGVQNDNLHTTIESISEETSKQSDNVSSLNKEKNNIIENTATNTYSYKAKDGQTYKIIGKLEIPSLNINYAILSETTDALLKISLTKYWGADPNKVGNMVVLGHNYKTDQFFSKLDQIKIGDIIKITDLNGKTLDYSVYKTDIIDPYDNKYTSQKTNGNTEITLMTCYNDDANRFVVKARAKI